MGSNDKVADDYADLLDGSWDSGRPTDKNGNASSQRTFWTGSSDDGTEYNFGGSRALGTEQPASARLNGSNNPQNPLRTGSSLQSGSFPPLRPLPGADGVGGDAGVFREAFPRSSRSRGAGIPTGPGRPSRSKFPLHRAGARARCAVVRPDPRLHGSPRALRVRVGHRYAALRIHGAARGLRRKTG